MPRIARVDVGNEYYHVINRSNGRLKIFEDEKDYRLFEELLLDTKELVDMRILAYVFMPNHWHLLLYPKKDGDLSNFMHRLTNAHTRKVHALTGTNGSGHLYQGRYKSFLVDTDTYILGLIKYIERNPVRAKLAKHPEDWQWGSAWRRINGNQQRPRLLTPSPTPLPHGYRMWINIPEKEDALLDIRTSVNKGVPYGRGSWVQKMVAQHKLHATLHAPGRPKKIVAHI